MYIEITKFIFLVLNDICIRQSYYNMPIVQIYYKNDLQLFWCNIVYFEIEGVAVLYKPQHKKACHIWATKMQSDCASNP